ncbi:plasmid maintenance system killer [Hyphomicrobium sp.]|uniref:plasmid maintenance system killer n=1 Tax=Hyphomicrobium sp. TaxID=82 RepID=UPI002FDF367E
MKIRNVVNPGLRFLIAEDEPAGARDIDVSRLRRILSFLQDMAGTSELHCVAGWTVQPPSGAGRGRWELRAAPVGAVTFGIDAQDDEITNLDYERNG